MKPLVELTALACLLTGVNSSFAQNWTRTSALGLSWSSIASSADGSKLVAGAFTGTLYVSTDSGTNWTATSAPSSDGWQSVACSADGTISVAVAGMKNAVSGPVYTSTNSGTTWVAAIAPVSNWVSVAASADGRKFVAAGAGSSPAAPNPVYSSTDSGITWAEMSSQNPWWSALASSADGSKLAAAATGGIYTSQTTPAPVLNITPSSNNLVFSWIVPSKEFILQQNSDLTSTNWMTLTNTPKLNCTNLHNEMVLSGPSDSSFYRLVSRQ